MIDRRATTFLGRTSQGLNLRIMQQDAHNLNRLKALIDCNQKDVKAIKVGDQAARSRLVDRSAELQQRSRDSD